VAPFKIAVLFFCKTAHRAWCDMSVH